MSALPAPPELHQNPHQRAGSAASMNVAVPRYFTEVRVPGYDTAKTAARARRRKENRLRAPAAG